MFGSVSRLVRNKRGAFAIQFALMAVPLTVCTGLAIDGGRAFLARFELASALDAAALAVGSTLQTQGTDLNAVAAKFVEKNFRTEHSEPVALTMVSQDDTIVLKGSVKINTFFMPLVGQPTVTVNAESEVRRGGSNIEVALALDITGSMTTSRMNGLRSASNVLIDEVVNPVQKPFFSKVAIVPWSQSINLVKPGTAAANRWVTDTALDQLRGGAIIGPRSISAASWRVSGASNQTISEAGWRTTTGSRNIASANSSGTGGIDWRYGGAVTVSSFSKVTVSSTARILVTTSSNHGYADGDYVRITGAGGSYTGLNNNIYLVEYYTSGAGSNNNKTYYLRKLDDSGYVAQPSGNTSSGASSQRCHDYECNVAVTTTSAFTGLAAGDFVNITSSTGFPSSQTPSAINNAANTTWVVNSVLSSTRFTLANWNGPNFGTMNSGGGTVSECLEASCRYRVTTNNNHGFSTSDYVSIWGMSESGSGTSALSALNTTWSVQNPSNKIFYLPGNGNTYKDWSSGGTTAKCQLNTCNTRITVGASTPASTLSVGDLIEVSGIGASSLSGINNPASISSPVSQTRYTWKISAISGSVLTLEDSSPAFNNMANNYTSGGVANCVVYGCARYDFVVSGGTASNYSHHRVYQASPCIVERYGDDAITDVAPSTSPLTIYYTSNGTCTQTNYVTPLTQNKTRLKNAITDLATGGSTSGHLGIAWAWYLLSPNFGTVWNKDIDTDMTPKEVNVPLSYEAPETAKIAILMTDGEFNYATCNTVNTGTACTPARTPFQQAEDICAEMKKQDIIIYTVGLELNTAQYSDDFLLKCATSPQHAFLANNNDELEQAFKDIAVSINRLRISR